MRIEFTQIYSEPGASFNLPGPLLGAISDGLDDLKKNIAQLSSKFDEGDFELVFIISASSKLDALEIKGPNIRRRAGEVEFSLFVPWRQTADFADQIGYVLPVIGEGVAAVFRRYAVDDSGVTAAIEAVLSAANNDPARFQYKRIS